MSAFTTHDEPGRVSVNQLLFLDIETTGLGGAGTVAFLIGLGSVTKNGFEVRQYLLPDYSDEVAILEAVAEDITDRSVLVTYNGASFDLPVIRERMIVNRVGRDIPHARHLDLLHASRRLFRRRIGDCSLVNIERELFHFERKDDIPGYLVPSVYFDWVSEDHLDHMEQVLEHNRFDIVSLYFMAVYLSRTFQNKGRCLDHIEDLHSLASIHGHRKNLTRTIEINERVRQLSCGNLAPDVLLFHAMVHKRAGDFTRAVPLWESVVEHEGREACLAGIELAKYYEHRIYDIPRALFYAERVEKLSNLPPSQRRLLCSRLKRLSRKLVL